MPVVGESAASLFGPREAVVAERDAAGAGKSSAPGRLPADSIGADGPAPEQRAEVLPPSLFSVAKLRDPVTSLGNRSRWSRSRGGST